MAHRKIVYLKVKVVLDLNNDDFPDRTSDEYDERIDDAIQDFMIGTDYTLNDTDMAKVVSTEIIGYDDKP